MTIPATAMKPRMDWIDALRGLTMMSVVLVHVLVTSFGLNPTQSTLAIIRGTFTLPLFFFISGYFLYRPESAWTPERMLEAIKVRGTALIGGTCLFATLYFVVTRRPDPLSWLPSADFVEYWYTISLFQIFFWYLVAVLIGRFTSRIVFRILIGLAFLTSLFLPVIPGGDTFWTHWWMSQKTAQYFQYFAFGLFLRRYQGKIFPILGKPRTLTLLICLYVGSLLAGWTYAPWWEQHFLSFSSIGLPDFHLSHMITFFRECLARWTGLLLILTIFYTYRDFFAPHPGHSRFIRVWLLIGRRTLDIYLLHYFFLPRMRWVGPYLRQGNTVIPELLAGAIVALAIIAVIMPLSSLLRRTPVLRRLLGAKPSKNN